MRKLILFGAGRNGMSALKKYGVKNVAYFCDNAKDKWNTIIESIKIVSFDDMVKLYNPNKYIVMVTPNDSTFLIGQLELAGIYEYVIYREKNTINLLINRCNDEMNYKAQNDKLDYYSNISADMDLLENVSEFRKLAAEVMKKNEEGLALLHYGIGEEGNFYGNLNTLLEYAEYTDFNKIYAPNVSHNELVPLMTTATQFSSAVIFSGDYYKEQVHKWKPFVPVFSVGPFIQYAIGIYNEERIKKKKQENGKTLTVFLPHSIEKISRCYNKMDFVDDIIEKYRNKFNTIYMSIYWADMQDKCCEYAERKGIKLVTSGFRFDPLFNKRLRSLLELSDAVIGGDIGTHYVYATVMEIPSARLAISNNQRITDDEFTSDLQRKIVYDEKYRNFVNQFYTAYDEHICYSNAKRDWANPCAGFGIKRDKEYLRNIFDISKDILLECDGLLENYPEAVKKVYKTYCDESLLDKMDVLINATGHYLNF